MMARLAALMPSILPTVLRVTMTPEAALTTTINKAANENA
jgi:hypothetical protein